MAQEKIMAITRITVRTFQNEQHEEMFITIFQNIMDESIKDGFKINLTMIQNSTLKIQSPVFGNMIAKYI